MCKFSGILMLMAMISGFHTVPAKTITIKVVVAGKEDKLTDKLLSDLRTDLRGKSNITIAKDSDDSSTFSLTVQYATIRSDNNLIGFFMSSILTKRIRTSKNEKGEILLNQAISSTVTEDNIDNMCSSLIDSYDVKYFEKERQ